MFLHHTNNKATENIERTGCDSACFLLVSSLQDGFYLFKITENNSKKEISTFIQMIQDGTA